MITRDIKQEIASSLEKDRRILVLFGARQVGKTTLLHELCDSYPNVAWYNGDEDSTKTLFQNANLADLAPLVQPYNTVIIDEAQRIENIGLKLKILYDNFGQDIQLIATGSSSFDLANKINEPLTGRKWTFRLFPLTIHELIRAHGYASEFASLHRRLIYGSYPAVIMKSEIAKNIVTELASDDLYKDVLNLGEIIKTDKLRKILQALALQLGSQVSMNELGQLVGLDGKTVDKYIALLEQSFIIFRLPSFSRNLRNELKASQKFYFYDCGIRNAILNDFRPIELRQDTGALFENYIISELKKRFPTENMYFWRTKSQQEIDCLIEKNGEITAIETKWSENKTMSLPTSFQEAYSPVNTFLINRANYAQILSGEALNYLD